MSICISRSSALFVFLFVLGWGGTLQAQDEPPPGLTRDEISGFVAPIALYPDVLISQILPAATFPTDIVQAARWVKDHPDLKGLEEQPWDPSVLSIARYPSVLGKMDTDLDWTNALGSAFLDQPDDVMDAIQTLRKQAQDTGVLASTPQQTVVQDEGAIRVVPAEKEVIYVPQYNPQIIYVDDDDDDDGNAAAAAAAAGAIGFGVGLAMGAWLDKDCDWHGHVVYGCRPGYWGGWGWHGHVNWDNDWYAYRGPRRGFVKGEHGGAAWGPNGRAVWGEHGAGVWRRPAGYGGRPAYTGRYRSYANVSGNRRNVVAGNTFNRNNVNVNIDRGDRTNIRGGDQTGVRTGDRADIGSRDRGNIRDGDRTNIRDGDRSNIRDADRANVNRGRPSTTINDRAGREQVNRQGDRGARSREAAAQRPNSTVSRPQSSRPKATTPTSVRSSGSSGRSGNAFSSKGSSRQTQHASSRGKASRSGGGGGRRGGGRR